MIFIKLGKRVVAHGGGITGFVSFIYRIPAHETCVIFFQNTPPRTGFLSMVQRIHDILDGKKVELPRVACNALTRKT
jgi:hypothetical protein